MNEFLKFETFKSSSDKISNFDNRSVDDDEGDEKLSAFDRGYAAGWTDGITAANTESRELKENLSNAIRLMQESRHQLRVENTDLIQKIVISIFEVTFGDRAKSGDNIAIAKKFDDLLSRIANQPAQVTVSKGDVEAVQKYISENELNAIEVVVNPQLDPNEVQIDTAISDETFILSNVRSELREICNQYLRRTLDDQRTD